MENVGKIMESYKRDWKLAGTATFLYAVHDVFCVMNVRDVFCVMNVRDVFCVMSVRDVF